MGDNNHVLRAIYNLLRTSLWISSDLGVTIISHPLISHPLSRIRIIIVGSKALGMVCQRSVELQVSPSILIYQHKTTQNNRMPKRPRNANQKSPDAQQNPYKTEAKLNTSSVHEARVIILGAPLSPGARSTDGYSI